MDKLLDCLPPGWMASRCTQVMCLITAEQGLSTSSACDRGSPPHLLASEGDLGSLKNNQKLLFPKCFSICVQLDLYLLRKGNLSGSQGELSFGRRHV